ncbi:hypothetical protein B9Z55_023509 [Caenorhabditis nigoni]|nr:hypothetical protein B9Z55_023509 [Caenorhabditis nigoni]
MCYSKIKKALMEKDERIFQMQKIIDHQIIVSRFVDTKMLEIRKENEKLFLRNEELEALIKDAGKAPKNDPRTSQQEKNDNLILHSSAIRVPVIASANASQMAEQSIANIYHKMATGEYRERPSIRFICRTEKENRQDLSVKKIIKSTWRPDSVARQIVTNPEVPKAPLSFAQQAYAKPGEIFHQPHGPTPANYSEDWF